MKNETEPILRLAIVKSHDWFLEYPHRYLPGVRVCGSVTGMIAIHKKIVVDERGKPLSVLIPWEEFCELSEALGLDLDKGAKADLRATRRDLKRRKTSAFKPLSEI
jgi:PHD/YefM family antitoxin component YafN of YafNO toxin-antitoxin module